MHPTHHRSLPRRFTARLGLAALLVLALFALTRCQMVSDRLTGIDLMPLRNSAITCVVECQVVANQDLRAESDLHVSLVQACGDDADCLAAEELRHEAAVESVQAKRRECANGCHHQGGGEGGS